MKVGVITLHRPINYGAVLQAYALQRAVTKYNIKCEIIDYVFDEIEKRSKIVDVDLYVKFRRKPVRLLKKIIGDVVFFWRKFKRKNGFYKFRERYMNLSKKRYLSLYELENNPPIYDIYIIGSDLVWNYDVNRGINPVYFLDFVKDHTKNKVSYASSIGTNKIEKKYLEEYKKYLVNINTISVREKTTAKQLQILTSKKVYCVLDPTLLLDKEEWGNMAVQNKIKFRYMLVYSVESSNNFNKIVNKIHELTSLRIVHFGIRNMYGSKAISKYKASPQEFLSLFMDAEIIVTNSFHGVIFSIINKKDFWCINHSTRGIRISDLLETLGLSERIIENENEIKIDSKINYEDVYKKLEEEKEHSLNYLERCINLEENEHYGNK